jgi:hypothetical protein
MSARLDVLMWAQRVVARKGAPAHQLLEIRADASLEDAQNAFHKVARMAHPDLHRNQLTPEELERVTTAYAAVAGAYQTFRSQAMVTQRIRPLKETGGPPSGTGPIPATPSGPAPATGAAASMTPRALVYYRKAELALRRGDLKGALLQLRMAIGCDPGSALLRTALAEVEGELRKGT